MQAAVTVLESAEPAAALLDPVRLRILEGLREPGSAAGVARRLGVPRQRVAYHVKELERHGLLRHVEDRRKGNCVERVMETAARQFVISPRALGALGADPQEVRDRVSSSYLVAVAARTLDEVAGLRQAADAAGKRLATLTLDTVVRFPTPAAQRAFADELTQAVARLAARHGGAAEGEGRAFRVVAAVHPLPAPATTTTETAS
jgi:DNA-binding transcriptional ArsR family regulator